MFTRRFSVLSSAAAIVVISAACSSSDQSATTNKNLTSSAAIPAPPANAPKLEPATFQIAPDLPLLKGNIAYAARGPEAVRAAYNFAARHPEVLKFVPCFCGCETMGHKGNDDCFVSKRNAKGQVTDWVEHGQVCEICIDVAQQAMQMHNSGASAASIRDAIEKKYTGHRGHTPTPNPPKSGGTQHQH